MPRRPRREFGGGLGHVTARTVRRLPLFVTERDALALLSTLDYVTQKVAAWSVLTYCLMPNHLHLLVDAEVDELARAMQRLNGSYAQRFNREHGFTGHLFQGRYGLKPVRDEAHLPETVRYVVLNPVRAGLCDRPEQWRWSSYRACLGLAPAPRFLDVARVLSCFGWDSHVARERLRSFVDDALPRVPTGSVPGTDPERSAA